MRVITKFILVYIIYLVLGGLYSAYGLRPSETVPKTPNLKATNEKVLLIDDSLTSFEARIDLIDSAEETLDISYYSLHPGEALDVFYAAILRAADRGVKVRFLVDGVANGQFIDAKVVRVFNEHPNIKMYYYNPINLAKPWLFNHRLHCKYIFVDDKCMLTGGRNVGNKYFGDINEPSVSLDRDIIIFASDVDNNINQQARAYFEDLLALDFVKESWQLLANFYKDGTISTYKKELGEKYNNYRTKKDALSLEKWEKQAIKVNKMALVTNGLEQTLKTPNVWQAFLGFIADSKKEIIIQSPYVVPSRQMRSDLENIDVEAKSYKILTNSSQSSNNLLANAGYLNHRSDLKKAGVDILEYNRQKHQLHIKTFMFDRQVVAIGSFNFDSRSAYLNTETLVFIDSKELCEEIIELAEENYIPESIEQSTENSKTNSIKSILIQILRPLSKLAEPLL